MFCENQIAQEIEAAKLSLPALKALGIEDDELRKSCIEALKHPKHEWILRDAFVFNVAVRLWFVGQAREPAMQTLARALHYYKLGFGLGSGQITLPKLGMRNQRRLQRCYQEMKTLKEIIHHSDKQGNVEAAQLSIQTRRSSPVDPTTNFKQTYGVEWPLKIDG